MSSGLKLGAAAMGFLIVAVIAVLLFNDIWFKVGFGAALALLCAILLFVAWRVDKKEKDARAGLEDLPNV